MTTRQKIFIGVLVFMGCVLVVGPSLVSGDSFIIVFVVASAIVWPFAKQITPKSPSPPSPLQILEKSSFWRGVAIAYSVVIVVVVVWHLFIDQLALFDDPSIALLLVLILGPAVGPIVANLVITYKMLGRDD